MPNKMVHMHCYTEFISCYFQPVVSKNAVEEGIEPSRGS